MQAVKLIVTVADPDNIEESTYEFPVYEFHNGLILVIDELINDWFFEDRGQIQANGLNQMVIGVTESSESIDRSLEDLQESIKCSLTELGRVPQKALKMLDWG